MEIIDITIFANGISIILLLPLLFIYVKNYKTIKSKFCVGLIVFGLLFLIKDISSLYFQISMSSYYTHEVADFALLLNIVEAFAFGVLLITIT